MNSNLSATRIRIFVICAFAVLVGVHVRSCNAHFSSSSRSKYDNFFDSSFSRGEYDNSFDSSFSSSEYDNSIDSSFSSSEYDNSIDTSSSSGKYDETSWSTPEECLRSCREDEPPRFCYYHFTLEYFTTMNDACTLCKPKNTNQLSNSGECQCIEADGFERTVFSINRMIPGPSIQVCLNDYVIIDVDNKIEGIGVTLHWHGIFQEGYQYYDGVPFLTQCPIAAPNSFRYQFRVKNSGTHFYHSHVAVHKIDGQYGSLIVRQPRSVDPQTELYDEDLPTHVILLSDWFHELSMERFPGLLNRTRGQIATNILINGKGYYEDPNSKTRTNTTIEMFDVEPGKRYRFRMINAFSTVCLAQLNIEDHTVMVIAQDGENVEPQAVDTIISGSGERVDFILTTNQTPNRSYWIQVRGINECELQSVNQLGILRYSESNKTKPPTKSPEYSKGLREGIVYNSRDALCSGESGPNSICVNNFKSLEPVDEDLLAVDVDYQFMLPFTFYTYRGDIKVLYEPGHYHRFFTALDRDLIVSLVDGITYSEPPGPLLTKPTGTYPTCNSTTNSNSNNPRDCTHVLNVKKGSVVEIVIIDQNKVPRLAHPFHLHGYSFRLFDMGRFEDNLNVTAQDMAPIMKRHRDRLRNGYYVLPPAKDTVIVPQGGWVILRFKADNPGWWLFHCHFIWHTMSGMNFVIHVGEDDDLPPVPSGFPSCGNYKPPIRPNE